MKNTNIVKLDRTTVQEYLPMLTHRGVFSNFNNLPQREDILKAEMNNLGTTKLTQEQEREALTRVSKYRSTKYVIRDYGDYAIAFSAKFYLDNLLKTEEELKDEVLRKEYGEEQVNEALKKINTYKLAHKIAILILSEVYLQKKHEEIIITKHELLTALGYSTNEKYIYSDIKAAMHSLRWLDYKIFTYKTKNRLGNSERTGNFISNLYEDSKEYKLWVNPLFVGCAIHMAKDGDKLTETERKQLFSRGYLEYPINHIAESRQLSDAGHFLNHHFLIQQGNAKLSTKKYKVLAIRVKNLMEIGKIENKRADVRVNNLLSALDEITHIQQIQPPMKELRSMKSKRVEDMTLHIYLTQQKRKKSTPSHAKRV